MQLEIEIRPARAARVLGGIVLLLLLAHLAGLASTHAFGHPKVFGLVPMFDLDREGNVPTFFSALLLLSSAALLAAIAAARRAGGDPFSRYWAGLSAIFLFLALDEAASIHEILLRIRDVYSTQGVLHFPWVIVYVPLALVVAVVYLRFLAALPRPTTALFLLAGALYVGGAAGMEVAGGARATVAGEENLGYALITTVEEVLEMAGLVVFLYALLRYAQRTGAGSRVRLSIGGEAAEESPAPTRITAAPRPGAGLGHTAGG